MLILFCLIFLSYSLTFENWVNRYNKQFTTAELLRRRAIYIDNLNYVVEHSGINGVQLSLDGPYATLTNEEYKSLLRLQSVSPNTQSKKKTVDYQDDDVPTSFDLRNYNHKNYVNTPGDQGNCGSCYSFAITAYLDTNMLLNYDEYTVNSFRLSTAEIISCANNNYKDCHGCDGGSLSCGLQYVKNKGLCLEEQFKFCGKDNNCPSANNLPERATEIDGIESASFSMDLEGHKRIIYKHGGSLTAMDSSRMSYQLYAGGIYQDSRCSQIALNHAVNIVGYGVENYIPYFIVKNSYGSNWGEMGYIRVRADNNMCGLSTNVYWVDKVKKA
ncbi:cysteine proteinase 1 precursor, putative [Entamoeba invadens IP1]|uniref:Cysteine proteinase 1, putative n=2 Tax=Entamoeba invadens TaxID=33085 RepID=L7FN83_ENTIV|nr:cysteine proteinase 1 precursor, putative [Entamoeba invadens IP1]BAN40496.1 cysteine proteinase 1 precursor, putative [Entamoeba invadens]ELP92981.1 cysteine proteinase 1 precursor, putative [Entamoeba invadens IP1]BAN40778.1 cysteine proteinase 1 precursor, putative [Entamoeba invadens]BAN41180.1 cysteine proteinase 1 precursor, putative [Entamoeba invadens]BAN41870.1 cysteine proteinase 1 precursor, putative [Entamoeba invadens]|eukprot:XP_004259752.1 cysteine proteinase 1 precursor, putative [Entamoeba invadens IP1]